jgi:hypothetical protein
VLKNLMAGFPRFPRVLWRRVLKETVALHNLIYSAEFFLIAMLSTVFLHNLDGQQSYLLRFTAVSASVHLLCSVAKYCKVL